VDDLCESDESTIIAPSRGTSIPTEIMFVASNTSIG
jgi:hypothetical protein